MIISNFLKSLVISFLIMTTVTIGMEENQAVSGSDIHPKEGNVLHASVDGDQLKRKRDDSEQTDVIDENITQDHKRLKTNHYTPEQEAFMSKLIFVHCTSHFPKEGLMIAGAARDGHIIPTDYAIPERCTLHFTLNSPVTKELHTDSTITAKPYCILETMKALEGEWYGGVPEDMMVVGTHVLSEQSVIFVPEAQEKDLRENNLSFMGQIIPYNESSTAPERAIEFIKENDNYISFTFKDRRGDKTENICTEIKEKGVDPYTITLKEFFSPISSLGKRYFGAHEDSRIGIVDGILSHLNNGFSHNYLRQIPSSSFYDTPPYLTSPRNSRGEIVLLDYHRKNLEEELQDYPYSIKEFIKKRDLEINEWLELIKFDIRLRPEQGRSIYYTYTDNLNIKESKTKDLDQFKILSEFYKEYPLYHLLSDGLFYEYEKPILAQVIACMSDDDIYDMLDALKGKLFIDGETRECIKNADKRFWKCSDHENIIERLYYS